MAFLLSKELETGVTGNYWRITHVEFSPKNSLMVTVGLYLDKATRDGGRLPLMQVNFDLPLPETDNLLAHCYEALKSVSANANRRGLRGKETKDVFYFEGAVDE